MIQYSLKIKSKKKKKKKKEKEKEGRVEGTRLIEAEERRWTIRP